MFVEFTDGDNKLVLLNADRVTLVHDGLPGRNVTLFIGTEIKVNVRQSFEEVKKRLGMAITPRAETIAAPYA